MFPRKLFSFVEQGFKSRFFNVINQGFWRQKYFVQYLAKFDQYWSIFHDIKMKLSRAVFGKS